MNVYLDYIFNALSGYQVTHPQSNITLPASVLRVELFIGQALENGVLYVADGEAPSHTQGALFLVANGKADAHPDCLGVSGISAAGALNLIVSHISRASRCLEALRSRYYGHHDLTGFCETLADYMGNPVIAYDDSVIPIAQSPFPPEFARENFGADSMNSAYVFRSITGWAREDNPHPLPMESFGKPGAFRTVSYDGQQSTIMSGIVIDGVTYGFLEVFEINRLATEGEMRLLEEACQILAIPYPFEDNRFITSRLEGHLSQDDLTDVWLSALRWQRDDPIFVVAVNLPPVYSDSMHNTVRAMHILRSVAPGSVCVQMGDAPVLVANNRYENRQRVVNTLSRFLVDTGTEYQLGVSELLTGIGRLHEGYVHARFAARYAARPGTTGPVTFFDNCQFAFFREICNIDANESLVIDAAVARMHAEDAANGTDNTLTAKTFIETGFNLNATARSVNVHRNTVAYRLKQINDRYGIDLSTPVANPNLVFRILISCKILLGDA